MPLSLKFPKKTKQDTCWLHKYSPLPGLIFSTDSHLLGCNCISFAYTDAFILVKLNGAPCHRCALFFFNASTHKQVKVQPVHTLSTAELPSLEIPRRFLQHFLQVIDFLFNKQT